MLVNNCYCYSRSSSQPYLLPTSTSALDLVSNPATTSSPSPQPHLDIRSPPVPSRGPSSRDTVHRTSPFLASLLPSRRPPARPPPPWTRTRAQSLSPRWPRIPSAMPRLITPSARSRTRNPVQRLTSPSIPWRMVLRSILRSEYAKVRLHLQAATPPGQDPYPVNTMSRHSLSPLVHGDDSLSSVTAPVIFLGVVVPLRTAMPSCLGAKLADNACAL